MAIAIVGVCCVMKPTAKSEDMHAEYDPIFAHACGPVNLYLGMRLLGIAVDFDSILTSCDMDGYGQTSLAALEKAAREHGACVLSMKTDLRVLVKLRESAILHVMKPKDHFLLYGGFGDGRIKIFDGTQTRVSITTFMKPAELARIWDGNMMIISRIPVRIPRKEEGGRTVRAGLGAGIIVGLVFVLIHRCRRYRACDAVPDNRSRRC